MKIGGNENPHRLSTLQKIGVVGVGTLAFSTLGDVGVANAYSSENVSPRIYDVGCNNYPSVKTEDFTIYKCGPQTVLITPAKNVAPNLAFDEAREILKAQGCVAPSRRLQFIKNSWSNSFYQHVQDSDCADNNIPPSKRLRKV